MLTHLADFNAYLAAFRKVVAFRIYFGFLLNQKIDREPSV